MPTVVLRAAVVLGSGSASFEMLRYLTERLPVMVTPRWVHSRIQPIAVRDVLRYLVGCAPLPPTVHRCFDIGGPDVMNYAEMMQRYAGVAGLPRRRILPVPLFSPSLSSHWVGLITPVPAGIARPLVESLRNTVVCREHDIAELRARIRRRGCSASTRRCGWPCSGCATPTSRPAGRRRRCPGAPSRSAADRPGLGRRQRCTSTSAPAPTTARPRRCGGSSRASAASNGWYSFPLAWAVRGWLDRLVGGVGLRRGRRDPHRLLVGDALDFWRVEEREAGRLLRLRAEMRLPGLAWLEFHVEHGDGRRDRAPAAGHLRPARPGRPPLLVGDRRVPRRRLRRHDPRPASRAAEQSQATRLSSPLARAPTSAVSSRAWCSISCGR